MSTDCTWPPFVTGMILAGGRATRMQGRDKGLIMVAGRPLIRHVIDRLQPQVDELLINANRSLDDYRRFGFPVFSDARPDFQGPLSGMLAGLRRIDADGWLVCVPCDAPQLPRDLVARFCRALTPDDRLAVADDGHWLQPAFCMLHASLADSLDAWLAEGGRKTGEWLRRQQAVRVDFSDQADAFTNLNSPDDLQHYQENAC